MVDFRSMVPVANSISPIHKKNSTESDRDYTLCEKYANISRSITIGIPVSYIFLATLFQLPTIIDIFTKDIIRPSASIHLPGVNESDTIQMIALLLINVMAIALVLIIFYASETFTYIIFLTIPMLSTIIQRQINDFKNELKCKKKAGNFPLIKKQLIEIIEIQLEYNE